MAMEEHRTKVEDRQWNVVQGI